MYKPREFPSNPAVRNLHFHCKDLDLIPVQGTKIPQAAWCSRKKKKNLMTTSGTVSTEHMCGLRINSVFEHLNFTVTSFKSTKSTEKEHSKYLKEKKAANTVKPSLVPPSAIPQGTPCIVWRVLNFIVLMLMSDSLRPFGL